MSNNNDCQNIKISYFIEEIENQDKEEINIEELMAEIENTELNDELTIPKMINYNENYTVKELLLICDYYGFAKELKNNKYNKEEIINVLVHFENEPLNNNIFMRRQSMWYYINELKKDKFMKKYVLW
jgi:arginine deiminase